MLEPLYLVLAITTALYAALLERIKERIEPDWTWLEVVIGVSLCLLAAAIRARLHASGWQEYEAGVWWAFIYGGAPIIIWQVLRMSRRWREALTYARERRREPPETLADKRGKRAD